MPSAVITTSGLPLFFALQLGLSDVPERDAGIVGLG